MASDQPPSPPIGRKFPDDFIEALDQPRSFQSVAYPLRLIAYKPCWADRDHTAAIFAARTDAVGVQSIEQQKHSGNLGSRHKQRHAFLDVEPHLASGQAKQQCPIGVAVRPHVRDPSLDPALMATVRVDLLPIGWIFVVRIRQLDVQAQGARNGGGVSKDYHHHPVAASPLTPHATPTHRLTIGQSN